MSKKIAEIDFIFSHDRERTPIDRRTGERKRLELFCKNAINYKQSDYGIWAHLTSRHFHSFTTPNLN